jgi:hypothetical protein
VEGVDRPCSKGRKCVPYTAPPSISHATTKSRPKERSTLTPSPLHTAAVPAVAAVRTPSSYESSDHAPKSLAARTVPSSSRQGRLLLCSHEEQAEIAKERNLFPCDSLEIASWRRGPQPPPSPRPPAQNLGLLAAFVLGSWSRGSTSDRAMGSMVVLLCEQGLLMDT